MSDPGPCHVACAVVGDFLPHAAAMLASLIENGGEPHLVVHLLHDESVPAPDRERLAGMLAAHGVPLHCLPIDDARIAGLPTERFNGRGSWFRVFLPELLPDVDRLLYLDVDLLVLGPIVALREVDLSSSYLGAVTNVFVTDHGHIPEALGLAGPGSYFNAGVLIMNLAAMRRDDSARQVLEYGRTAEELFWPDQDALNVVLGESRVHLHPRWNCMNSVMSFPQSIEVFGKESVDEARRSPAIRHFEGPLLNKPWHYLADSDMQQLYLRHRRATPWPDVELEDRTLATMAIRRLPSRHRTSLYRRLLFQRARLRGRTTL